MKVAFGRNIDIIAESADIKEALYLRFYELNLSNTAVCRDARNKGHRIYESSLSRYLSTLKKETGRRRLYIPLSVHEGRGRGLSQKDVLWLCARYCIKIRLNVEVFPYSKKEGRRNHISWHRWRTLNYVKPKKKNKSTDGEV